MPIKEKIKHISMLEYVQTQRDNFSTTSFHEVDALVFAQISYMQLDRLVSPLDNKRPWVPISSFYKAEEFDYTLSAWWALSENRDFLMAVCASPRYRDVLVNYFADLKDVDVEKQFSAVTFKLPSGEAVVAFRGTDTSAVGWKEDFNMAIASPVPSQIEAVKYLEEVTTKTRAPLYLVGHSKGGNLAAYSLSFAKLTVQNRVKRAYCLDSPGFPPEILAHKGHIEMAHKTVNIMPEGSIVGILFDKVGEDEIIKSNSISLFQHNPFYWQIIDNSFARADGLAGSTKFFDKAFQEWLYTIPTEQLRVFTDTIFTIISATNAETLPDFARSLRKERTAIFKALKEIDPETGKFVKQMLKQLARISLNSVFVREHENEKVRPVLRSLAETFSSKT